MKKKKLILVSISLLIVFSLIYIVMINRQPNTIDFNDNKYTNQKRIVPYKFISKEIGSKSGYSYYEIRNSNKEYHLAVKIDDTYYYYKTEDANGINFAESPL